MAVQVHVHILPQTPLPSTLPHNIEQLSVTQFLKFFIEGQLLYNIALVSAIYQHEAAIGTHMFPPPWISLPPPTPSHPYRLSQSQAI